MAESAASANFPKILALDFDGVICDGLLEYFESSQRTYQQIWPQDSASVLAGLAESFYQLRPVVESGWEMPILLRALFLGIEPTSILQNWSTIAQQILATENLDKQTVMAQLDEVRDHWITEDLSGWLSRHQFYAGVVARLQQILAASIQLYIVTTKEGRFVRQLLQQQGLELTEGAIIGKEIKRPKQETLQEILKINAALPPSLWFVEDLLKTLRSVQQQTELQGIQLFLAAWGYNTPKTRMTIAGDCGIRLLSLEQFTQDFKYW
jgi:phosphoglycolate phosphatase-like HAD superfamily hydrolase